jgi:hypothetical protein
MKWKLYNRRKADLIDELPEGNLTMSENEGFPVISIVGYNA